MNQIKAKLLPHNPEGIYLTSTGWKYPDGTFKPHYVQKVVQVVPAPGLFARVFGR